MRAMNFCARETDSKARLHLEPAAYFNRPYSLIPPDEDALSKSDQIRERYRADAGITEGYS